MVCRKIYAHAEMPQNDGLLKSGMAIAFRWPNPALRLKFVESSLRRAMPGTVLNMQNHLHLFFPLAWKLQGKFT